MISFPLVRYVLKAAMRDRLILSFFLILVLSVSLSIFLGSAAVTEKDQFVLVFSAAGLRLAGVLGLVLFVVFYIRRSFDTKDVDFLLSRPLGRTNFILSHAVGFIILALFFVAGGAGVLFGLSGGELDSGIVLWVGSILAEYIIMVCAALFFSMIVNSASSAALACFAFYLLSRMMGQILGIIDAGISPQPFLSAIMQVISAVMPRFDLMGQASWILYGTEAGGVGGSFLAAQGAFYSSLLLMAAILDLLRRQF